MYLAVIGHSISVLSLCLLSVLLSVCCDPVHPLLFLTSLFLGAIFFSTIQTLNHVWFDHRNVFKSALVALTNMKYKYDFYRPRIHPLSQCFKTRDKFDVIRIEVTETIQHKSQGVVSQTELELSWTRMKTRRIVSELNYKQLFYAKRILSNTKSKQYHNVYLII